MSDTDLVPAELRQLLDKFSEESGRIVSSFTAQMEKQEPPPIIYHYTNDVGLRGILETGQLWLTDIFSLNDPSELKHGFSHAVELLNGRTAQGTNNDKVFAKQFSALISEGGLQASAHYFVCSFSSDGDDLGQWRAYADNGRGFALGFDAKALEAAFGNEDGRRIPNNTTFPVSYNDAQLADLHRQIIEYIFESDLLSAGNGRGLSRSAFVEYMNELGTYLTVPALHAAVFFKHEAYRNEKEYRFLQIFRGDVPPPDFKIRMRPQSLIRYREFDWKELKPETLKVIKIGPAADYEKAGQFVRDCLRTFHNGTAQAVQVGQSTIPYRAT